MSLPSSYRSRRGHIHLPRVLPLVGCLSKTPTGEPLKKFMDLLKKVYGPKNAVSKLIDLNDTCLQVNGPTVHFTISYTIILF
jgi:hypothetical protein